jgi:protocatechuate 4,5-dioxygenase beta chain
MALLWPGATAWPVRLVPVCVNTVQFPLPSAVRCYKLGEAIGRALEAWESDAKVLLIGTGGLSHQLDGARAGFINKQFDREFLRSLTEEPKWATRFSIPEIVEKAGTQGVELLMWLAARAALHGKVRTVHSNYHIPISNTASALLALETLH